MDEGFRLARAILALTDDHRAVVVDGSGNRPPAEIAEGRRATCPGKGVLESLRIAE